MGDTPAAGAIPEGGSGTPSARWPALQVVRLLLALLVTWGVLLYAWLRCLVFGMLRERPEALYLALLVGGILAVMALTFRLSRSFSRPATSWFVALALAAGWLGALAWLVAMRTGTLLPRPVVAGLLIPATLWVPWAAWMFCWPMRPVVRLSVLVPLVLAVLPFPLLLRTQGLTGDAGINFAWRTQGVATAPLETAAAAAVDFPTRRTDQDYPQFLGPQRLGVLPGARLARDWSARPPRLVWRKPVGEGWGAFAVAGDYALTQEQRGEQECVVCYRVSDGSAVWVHADQTRYDSSMGGPGPRATPTVQDGRVYSVGATGRFNCVEGATGRVVWSVDLLADNNGENVFHGVCGSPLVVDDLVLACPTGSNGICLAAYDRATGRRVWQGRSDRASYGSPLLTEIAGVRQVLLYHSEGVSAFDPSTGELLWRFGWTNGERTNCSQPIPHAGGPDRVLVATGYDKGSVLLDVRRADDSTLQPEVVWESRAMATKFTTAVLHRGYVYGLDNGILACVDLANGRRLWKAGRYQHGQVLLAGDLLLVQAEDGRVVLVEPSPEGLKELGRIPALDGKTWNNPALAGQCLLVRNDHEAACYELPLQEGKESN
jgi:outer membrane protein assembly factor BamB